ncbi:MAG TPA: glycosyltransferase [Candidatus Rubrimentiphilum sp.]|nr:glycosyltransferase [Candidatus Rubrimentiphilum sp.]
MKRIVHIVRGYGLSALLRRAAGRAADRVETARRAAAAWRADRLAARLPKSPKALGFATRTAPLVTVLVTDARDWRRMNRCLLALQSLQNEIPLDVVIAYDRAIEREVRMHDGVRLLTHPAGTPLKPVLAQAAEGRGRFLAVVGADAIPSRRAIERQMIILEREDDIAAAAPRSSPISGSMLRMEFLRGALPEMPDDTAEGEVLNWLCRYAGEHGSRCLYHDDDVAAAYIVPAAGALLVVDEHVPFDDRDAGSRRIAALMSFARAAKWNVTFGSVDARAYPPYGDRLRNAGVEVVLGFRPRTLAELTAHGRSFDCVWLSRAKIAAGFADDVRSLQPKARIVYDTVDLHHLRLARQEAAIAKRTGWAEIERAEMESAQKSDIVVVTSAAEKTLLEERGLENIALVGLAEAAVARSADYRDTEGVLFVGNYAHEPNVDAALWLAREIMPLVWREVPQAVLTLSGADPTAAVRRLAERRIRVPGFVRSLDPLLNRARVFAAPLRFGAGLKGKILLALSAGIPVVTTSVGAEGIAQSPGDLAVADDARSFASAVTRIYGDEAEWRRYSAGASRAAARFSPQELARSFLGVLEKI